MNEKKMVSALYDCLLQVYNRVVQLYTLKQEQPEEFQTEYSPIADYNALKGRHFSIFYENSYLYFTIQRYLKYLSIPELGEQFLNAAKQDLVESFMDKTSERNEKNGPGLKDLIFLWRILNTLGEDPPLQDCILRYIWLITPKTPLEAFVKGSFFLKHCMKDEGYNIELEELFSYSQAFFDYKNEDQSSQQHLVRYFIEMVNTGKYTRYLDKISSFEEYTKRRFGQDSKEAEADPSFFYGRFFPRNGLGCSISPYVDLEYLYYKEIVQNPLASWIQINSQKESATEFNILEPLWIKSLLDDFCIVANSNIIQNSENLAFETLEPPRLEIKSNLQNTNERVNMFMAVNFDNYVRNQTNIKVFKKSEIKFELGPPVKKTPFFLKQEKIMLFNGVIQSNQQIVSIFEVEITESESLKLIKDNLELMSIYSPFMIKFIGLIIDPDILGDVFYLHIVTDYLGVDLASYLDRFTTKRKDIIDNLTEFFYKIAYTLNSMIRIGIPPPFLNPYTIFISRSENPVLFIPFFTKSYLSLRTCFQTAHKQYLGKDTPLDLAFTPPFVSDLHELQEVLSHFARHANYRFTQISQMEAVWNCMERTAHYQLCLMFEYLFSNEYFLEDKNMKFEAFDALLNNSQAKLSLNHARICANIKKSVPQSHASLCDLLTQNLVSDTGILDLQTVVDLAEKLISPLGQVPTGIEYSLGILTSTEFSDEVALRGGDTQMRRIIYLPSKLAFNGFIKQRFIEAIRFYSGNNMVTSFTFFKDDPNAYNCDLFLDETKVFLLTVVSDVLMEAKCIEEHWKSDKRASIKSFLPKSWIPSEESWVKAIKKYFHHDAEDRKLRSSSEEQVHEDRAHLSQERTLKPSAARK
jgi:hypothetical protein